MAKIPKKMRWIYDLLLTAAILAMATVLCTLLRRIDDGSGYVNLIFVLAVATISRWTEGYFWGIFSAVSGVLLVNYVFTYPYWEFNFTITGYPFTFLAMLTVSMMISAMNTQIKKQERLRIETEKEAVRANLLRAMSHDIRTPLTSIVGNTAAILENEDSFSPEQKRRLLEDVNEDAQWLIRMVENLLSVTRIDGAKVKVVKTPTVLDELIDSVLMKFSKKHPNQKVITQIPDEFVDIPMDSLLIEQVLLNLLENAVFHAKGMTELTLSVSLVGDKAVFEVADNGCGIPEDALQKIFSGSYEKSAAPVDGTRSNMGIGLSVCAAIVKAHGSDITAENRKGGGAVFRFALERGGEDDGQ